MPQEPDPLARIKPLADPLRIFTRLAIAVGIINVFFFLLAAVRPDAPGPNVAGLAGAFYLWSLAALIAPGGRPNAIYLRAFRTDEETAALRAELAAGLGPDYRLAGIRPPRKRSSTLARVVVPGAVALRYAGSKFMELEAGDDWMARLWRTYQTTRVAFIDVRQVTEHVHREIRMTLETMGPERCIFVVGPGRTDAAWRALIGEIAGPEIDLAALRLLEAGPEPLRQGLIGQRVRAFERELPPGYPESTERGRAFVLRNVRPGELRSGRRIHLVDVAAVLAGIGILLAINYVLALSMGGPVLSRHGWTDPLDSADLSVLNLAIFEIGLPWGAVFLTIFFGHIRNARAREKRFRLAGHAARNSATLATVLLACGAGLQVLAGLGQVLSLVSSVNSF